MSSIVNRSLIALKLMGQSQRPLSLRLGLCSHWPSAPLTSVTSLPSVTSRLVCRRLTRPVAVRPLLSTRSIFIWLATSHSTLTHWFIRLFIKFHGRSKRSQVVHWRDRHWPHVSREWTDCKRFARNQCMKPMVAFPRYQWGDTFCLEFQIISIEVLLKSGYLLVL